MVGQGDGLAARRACGEQRPAARLRATLQELPARRLDGRRPRIPARPSALLAVHGHRAGRRAAMAGCCGGRRATIPAPTWHDGRGHFDRRAQSFHPPRRITSANGGFCPRAPTCSLRAGYLRRRATPSTGRSRSTCCDSRKEAGEITAFGALEPDEPGERLRRLRRPLPGVWPSADPLMDEPGGERLPPWTDLFRLLSSSARSRSHPAASGLRRGRVARRARRRRAWRGRARVSGRHASSAETSSGWSGCPWAAA